MRHYPVILLAASLSLFAASPAQATIVGFEDFNYPDGGINGRNGGIGWNVAGGVSDWTGGVNVVGGKLITDANSGAFREYGGNENASAFMATGIIFYRFELTLGATVSNYAGLSSFDFGSEKVFFGRTYANQLGIDESGVGTAHTGIEAAPNTTYTLIGVLDFNNDVLSLFVNPDSNDIYNTAAPSGAGNTADAIRTGFTSVNWSSQIRLQSGDQASGTAPVAWDNVTVATTPGDVGLAVPEPSTVLLAGLAGSVFFLRRRR